MMNCPFFEKCGDDTSYTCTSHGGNYCGVYRSKTELFHKELGRIAARMHNKMSVGYTTQVEVHKYLDGVYLTRVVMKEPTVIDKLRRILHV